MQDLLREDRGSVYALLTQAQAVVYVCGSAQGLGQGVHKALIDVLCTEGHMSSDDAEDYLLFAAQQGRYQRDVWG